MANCTCCRDGCLLVDVAERLEDAMVRQVASYYQGQYTLDGELLALFQLHMYVRVLICEHTAILAPDKILGLFRTLEGVPRDLRERFLVSLQLTRQRHQFVSGSPVVQTRQKAGTKERRWLKLLGS